MEDIYESVLILLTKLLCVSEKIYKFSFSLFFFLADKLQYIEVLRKPSKCAQILFYLALLLVSARFILRLSVRRRSL